MHEERSSVGGIGKTVGRDGNEAAHTQDGSEPIDRLRMPVPDGPETTSVGREHRWREGTYKPFAEELLKDIVSGTGRVLYQILLEGQALNSEEEYWSVYALLLWAEDAERILNKPVLPLLDTALLFITHQVLPHPDKLVKTDLPWGLRDLFELAVRLPPYNAQYGMCRKATAWQKWLSTGGRDDLEYTFLKTLAWGAKPLFERCIEYTKSPYRGYEEKNPEAEFLHMWSRLCGLEGERELRFASLGLLGLQGYDEARAQLGLTDLGALSGGKKVLYSRLLERYGSEGVATRLFNSVLKDRGQGLDAQSPD